MLINTQRAEQVRVAIVDGSDLKDFQVQITDKNLCRGNIYRGVVANIQPSLGAAFIDIGEDRHGFLPVADVQPAAYHRQPPKADAKRPRIDQVLERGKPILVQATKDGVGNKGAALSTNVALAGRYLVLTPFDSVSGISRKVEDDKARKTIRRRLGKLNIPEGHGVIVRTNGLGQNQATLNRDLNALLRMWKRVNDEGSKGRGPRLLYSDQDLIVQALRDYLDNSIAEVIVDDDSVYDKARTYMRAFMPRSKTVLTRYQERLPLFSRYNMESQIDAIYDRRAPLPSGGSLVIDGTEALTAIDVNSGRATQRGNHDESILSVNIEAAHEVARQLRLRDIGGLVVVDFIDMRTRKHQAKLEKAMRDAMKVDKARYSVGRISPNGLLEINRQRIKQALHQRTHRPCPSCHGVGSIASPEFAATTLLGRIEARVAPGLVEKVTAAVHPEIADALQNTHRARLAELEKEFQLQIDVISATNFRRTEDRIDYQSRENAVVPKPVVPALTSSDLAAANEAELAASEEADEKPAKTRKRRRRRRSRSKTAEAKAAETKQADGEASESQDKDAGASQASGDGEAAEQAASNGKPTRTRRRRRGGRRRKKADSADSPEPAQDAAEGLQQPAADDGSDWNVAMVESGDSPPEQPANDDPPAKPRRRRRTTAKSEGDGNESPKPRRRSRSTAKADGESNETEKPRRRRSTAKAEGDGNETKKPRRRRSAAKSEGDGDETEKPRRRRAPRKRAASVEDDAQPTDKDAWQSPLGTQPPPATPTNRSPLRRDRSTLRWQWWGGDGDDPAASVATPAVVPEPDDG